MPMLADAHTVFRAWATCGLMLHSVRIRKSLINVNNREYVFLILVNNS